ncbi:MAG: type II toxin-antitoxin system RelE/ParE family toxin [Phenylobacterium sp.]
MTAKPIIPREQARRDVEDAIDFYAAEAGQAVALRFIDAFEATIAAIGRHPAAGSPRYGHELGLPGLRSQLVKGFPYLIFYAERGAHVDVWRVLHAQRHIPAWLQEA